MYIPHYTVTHNTTHNSIRPHILVITIQHQALSPKNRSIKSYDCGICNLEFYWMDRKREGLMMAGNWQKIVTRSIYVWCCVWVYIGKYIFLKIFYIFFFPNFIPNFIVFKKWKIHWNGRWSNYSYQINCWSIFHC